jgi:PAS domain S-box-containing protein
MNKTDSDMAVDAEELRRRAEVLLASAHHNDAGPLSGADSQKLIHELQVHQIELEMQYEEVRTSRADVEKERGRYLDLYDFAPTGYVTLARNGAIAEVNLAGAKIIGFERATLIGKRFGMFVSESDRQEFNTFLERVFALATRQSCQLTMTGDLPALRVLQIEGELGPNGQECRTSIADITARVRAEEALQLRDRAIRAVTQGILITDPNLPDNPIIYANAGFERMTGYGAGEIVGRNCRILQGKDTDRESVARMRAAVEAGLPCTTEILNYRKDGTPFWNVLSLSPVRDDRGRVVQFIGVLMDVTEQRRLEQALRQAQRMEAVGLLAGGVAHDFNNLLTIINGYSDILRAELPEQDPLREIVSEIGNAGGRAAALTRQLLAFSRRQVLELRVLNLNSIITELGKTLLPLIGADIDLRTELDSALEHIKADSGQIEQVLINLAVNARDAMPKGGTLTIGTRNVVLDETYRALLGDFRPGPHVLLTISDTGFGMDENTIADAFEPYFTTKGVGRGTGLGLAMVYGIVKQIDGQITIASQPGRGTTILIYLPSVHEDAVWDGASSRAKLSPAGTETILVVEDEPSVRGLARRILELHGYVVLDCGRGDEAVQLVSAHSGTIDLVLTDVEMPVMGGRDLVETLRKMRPYVRVLFMSGYTDDDLLRHGIERAEEAFIQKPFTPGSLARKVREVLDQSSVADGIPVQASIGTAKTADC